MIYVCVLTRDSVNANTTCDLIQLLRENPSYAFACVCGIYVQNLREGTAGAVLASGATHLCFIDADMMFPKDAIEKLLKHDKEIIGANYRQRVMQDKWTAFKDGVSVSSYGKNGIEEVDSLGMGLTLIKTSVFSKLPKPWFPMEWKDGTNVGEDIGFCRLAKKNGYKIYVDHNLSQDVHHIGNIILGTDNYIKPEYTIPDIEGWMSPPEMMFLYEQAKKFKTVIEIGSWKGKSTHALASGCKGTVTCIDHWRGSEGDITLTLASREDVYTTFTKNTAEFKNIKVLRGFSHEIATENTSLKADMVFIDAGHNYDSCKQDIEDWLPRTKKLICGHDYSSEFPGVIKAVNEKFGKPDGVIDTLWYKAI